MTGSDLLHRRVLRPIAVALLALAAVGAPLPSSARLAQQQAGWDVQVDPSTVPARTSPLTVTIRLSVPSYSVTSYAQTHSVALTVPEVYGFVPPQTDAPDGPGGISASGTCSLSDPKVTGRTFQVRVSCYDPGMVDVVYHAGEAPPSGQDVRFPVTVDGTPLTDAVLTVTSAVPAALRFFGQPTGTKAGSTIIPPVVVKVLDQDGRRVLDSSTPVTIALVGGGRLDGVTAQSASGGVATFDDLSVPDPGTGLRLSATADGLRGATSEPFDVTPVVGPPHALVFVQPPTATTAGEPIVPPVVVAVRDAAGVPVRDAGTVTLTMAGGSLSGRTTRPARYGQATFDGLVVDRAGEYRLTATLGGLSQVSEMFEVTGGPAVSLAFLDQPVSGRGVGEPVGDPIRVAALDRLGNRAGDVVRVTLALSSGTGTAGAGLHCADGEAQDSGGGVTAFERCSVDRAGSGFRLSASSAALPDAVSDPFGVVATGEVGAGGGPGTSTLLLAAALLLLVLAIGLGVTVHHVRARRAVDAARVRAVPHVEVARLRLDEPNPELSHDVRLEPHADPGAWTLRDR